MFCLYCGTNLPDDAVFCNKCGKRQNAAANEPAPGVAIPPFPPLSEATTGGGQSPIGNVPMVQGIPSVPESPLGQSITQNMTNRATPILLPSVPPQPTENHSHPSVHHVPSSELKLTDHLSRRAVLLGLAGMATVAAVGGSVIWFNRSQQSSLKPTSKPSLGTTLLVYRGHVNSNKSALISSIA